MATRRKKVVTAVPTMDEAQEILREYGENHSRLKKMEAEMELKISKIREKYQPLADPLRETINNQFAQLEAFAIDNKDVQFSKKKSLSWVFGVIGFRTGTPKVNKKKGLTWAAVLELLKNNQLTEFIRTKEEIDKDKILSVRNDEERFEPLENLGVTVEQDEAFYVEVKEESLVVA